MQLALVDAAKPHPPVAYRHSRCSTVSITGIEFLILAILVAEKSVSNKDFICISLVSKEAEHFFMFYCPSGVFHL